MLKSSNAIIICYELIKGSIKRTILILLYIYCEQVKWCVCRGKDTAVDIVRQMIVPHYNVTRHDE